MPKEKLNEYIRKSMEMGNQEEEIKNNLLSVGWAKEDIEEAFLNMKGTNNVSSPNIPEENVDHFSNSLKDKINSIQEDNDNLDNQQQGNDPFLEPIEKETTQEEPSLEKNNNLGNQQQEKQKLIVPGGIKEDEFIDKSKKNNSKKIIFPLIIILVVALVFGAVFSFIQKIGPFSFLVDDLEVLLEEENIIPQQEEQQQEEVIVEEPIVIWSCGDELIDERDGSIYQTIQIGSQCWMKKNLNYITGKSYCYNNDLENCELYGRLYEWPTATTACPLDWRLPTNNDFKMLERYLGMEEEKVDATGWREISSNAQGTLDSLNITFAGARDISGQFKYLGEYVNFWLSDSVNELYYTRSFRTKDNNIYSGNVAAEYGYSVRCVK